jgi:hypothetical protein
MRNVHSGLVALLVATGTSAAQPPANWSSVQALPAGTEVRIAMGQSTAVSGKLENVTGTSLTLNPGSGPRSIDRQQVTRVSVKTKARRKRSTLIGLAVGAGGGAGVGGAAASSCSGNICGGHGAALIAGAATGGAIIGALIGAAVSHGGWRNIYKQ